MSECEHDWRAWFTFDRNSKHCTIVRCDKCGLDIAALEAERADLQRQLAEARGERDEARAQLAALRDGWVSTTGTWPVPDEAQP